MKDTTVEKTDYRYFLNEVRQQGLPEYGGVAHANLNHVESRYRTHLLPYINAEAEYQVVAGVEFAIERLRVLLEAGWQADETSEVMLEREIFATYLVQQLHEWQDYVIEVHG